MSVVANVHKRVTDTRGQAYAYVAASASIVRLDDRADEVLAAFAQGPRRAEDVFEGFAARPDVFELREAFAEMAAVGLLRKTDAVTPPAADLPPMPFPLVSLVLNVTNKCNLTCTYCYEFGEDRLTSPTRELPQLMSTETACASIDFLLKSSKDRPVVTVTFFGGETLLNWPAIRAAVEYAEEQGRLHKKRVHFALTTNATLLDEAAIAFLVAHRFGVTISVDGDRQEQDRHRKFKSGKGSFEVIEPKIKQMIAANKAARGRPVGARVTLTRGATDVRSTYAFLHGELGFSEVGFAPVTAAAKRQWAFDGSGYNGVLNEFAALAEDFVAAAIANEQHGFANLNDLLRELHQGVQKAHPCGAGLGLLGVSTAGELGLCHRFVESDSHAMGTVQGGIDEQKRSSFLQSAHIDKKMDCKSCFARPVCAGGCYHEAHVRHGDATAANLHACDWIRAWTDIGLRAYVRIMDANPSFFARYESA